MDDAIPPEAVPNVDHLRPDGPRRAESIFVVMQRSWLVGSLYPAADGDRELIAAANVGLFPHWKGPPLVPDVLLSLDVSVGDLAKREHQAYFPWVVGKFPDLVLEIVAENDGGEDGWKLDRYAKLGVAYYVIFDPSNLLTKGVLRAFERRGMTYHPLERAWFPDLSLGLAFWEGQYQHGRATWLRWRDASGVFLPSDRELGLGHERVRPWRRQDRPGRRTG